MASSLNDAGAGKTTGVISLIGVHTTSSATIGDRVSGNQAYEGASTPVEFGYRRQKSTGEDYNRIHWSAVASGSAPDPLLAATRDAPFSLADWNNYYGPISNVGGKVGWKERVTDIDITDITVTSATNAQATFSWTQPDGFDDYNSLTDTNDEILFRVYVKECTDQTGGTPGDVCQDSTDGWPEMTGSALSAGGDASSSVTVSGLGVNKWHVCSVFTLWDETHNKSPNDFYHSYRGDAKSSFGEDCTGVNNCSSIVKDQGPDSTFIIFKTDTWTNPCNSNIGTVKNGNECENGFDGACDTLGADTCSGTCYSLKTGGWGGGDKIYSNSSCTTEISPSTYVAFDNGGTEECWEYSSGLGTGGGKECDCGVDC